MRRRRATHDRDAYAFCTRREGEPEQQALRLVDLPGSGGPEALISSLPIDTTATRVCASIRKEPRRPGSGCCRDRCEGERAGDARAGGRCPDSSAACTSLRSGGGAGRRCGARERGRVRPSSYPDRCRPFCPGALGPLLRLCRNRSEQSERPRQNLSARRDVASRSRLVRVFIVGRGGVRRPRPCDVSRETPIRHTPWTVAGSPSVTAGDTFDLSVDNHRCRSPTKVRDPCNGAGSAEKSRCG